MGFLWLLQPNMDQGKKVWAPDLKEGFILGEISDFGTDVIAVQPLSGGKVRAGLDMPACPRRCHPSPVTRPT